jgi:nitrite reductase/ring-hydroxylating ferredoxin subunit
MRRLCRLDDITVGAARGFPLNGRSVIVVRNRSGAVTAWLNRCPHLGVPLNWQDDAFMDAEGSLLRCATHGALFEPDTGLCVLGPCRGESLWSLDCEIRDGDVLIDDSFLPPPRPP